MAENVKPSFSTAIQVLAMVLVSGLSACGPNNSAKTAPHQPEQLEIVLPEKPTEQEREWATFLQSAIQRKNIDALAAAEHSAQTNDSIRDISQKLTREFFRDMVSRPCVKLVIHRTDPETATEYMDGKDRIRESLPVRWHVTVIQQFDRWNTASYQLRAGIESNRVIFTQSEAIQSQTSLRGSGD